MPEGGHYSLLANTIYTQEIYGTAAIKKALEGDNDSWGGSSQMKDSKQ